MNHSERYKTHPTASSGVLQWLIKNKFLKSKSTQFYDSSMHYKRIVRDFLLSENQNVFYYHKKKDLSKVSTCTNCLYIQKKWDAFTKWAESNLTKM